MLAPLHRLALGLVPFDWLPSGLDPFHWLHLGIVLLVALAVGVCVHELLHVVPLRCIGAEYTVTVLPADDGAPSSADGTSKTADGTPSVGEDDAPATVWATLQSALTGGLVRVEVTHLPRDAPDWVVRVAALLPVVLAVPMLLVAAGVLPDPVAANDHLATALLVAAAACGLPSPADWAVVWHGSLLYRRDRAVDGRRPE